MNKKQLLILIFFICFSFSGISQVSISYYNSSLSKIGLAYDFSGRFWSEFRLYGNTDVANTTPEIVFCYRLIKRERHNMYLGLGGNINYFTGLVIPVGLQFKPVKDFDRFSLHIEFEPTFDIHNTIIWQSSWGLRYQLGKKEKNHGS